MDDVEPLEISEILGQSARKLPKPKRIRSNEKEPKKKVNTHKKGQRKELIAQKELEKEGYRVLFKSYTIKMGPVFKGIDFGDVFDLVAVKRPESDNASSWRFISVKHYTSAQTKYPEHQQDIHKFRMSYGLDQMSFELWIWYKPAWRGRGKNKKWNNAHFEKIFISETLSGPSK